MNRLLTFEGQMPLYLDDINFLQDSVKESLGLLVNALRKNKSSKVIVLVDPNVQFNGMSRQFEWNDGLVALDGEILPVRASSTPAGSFDRPLYYTIVTSYDADGKKTFKDGTVHDCHEIREATFTTEATAYPFRAANRLEDLFKDIVWGCSGEDSLGNSVMVDIIKTMSGLYRIQFKCDIASSQSGVYSASLDLSSVVPEDEQEGLANLGINMVTLVYGETETSSPTAFVHPAWIQFIQSSGGLHLNISDYMSSSRKTNGTMHISHNLIQGSL